MSAASSQSELTTDSEQQCCIVVKWPCLPTSLSIGFLTIAVLVYFGPCLFSDQSFAFRDAAHFYRPLFQWINGEWLAGRVPLWNPYDDLGTPVNADGSSSIFYPGKLIFLLPFSFSTNYKVYVIGHVMLAAVNMFWTARQWHRSCFAATLAGLAYSLGGSVLFQYSNCPYLVGAAWMPLVFPLIECSTRRQCLASQLLLAAIISLMILGGDPQAAYHTVILLGGYWLMMCGRHTWRDLAGWSAVAVIAFCSMLLSVVQLVPSFEWARASERFVADYPRTLYEVYSFATADSAAFEATNWPTALLGRPGPETHHEKIFHFSVGYWRWAELFWPNFGGRMFPVHCRWLSAIPAEGRVWTPSLYMGLLPILLAVSCLRFRCGSRRRRWLSWVAVFAALGASGWYGLGWLWSEIGHAIWGEGFSTAVGPQVGGIYWWMTVCLPNYVLFRYPAKLWCVVAVALSLLASQGCDRFLQRPWQRLNGKLIAVLSTSIVAFVTLFCLQDAWIKGIHDVAPDPIYGPLDANLAWKFQLQCFAHVMVLVLVLLVLTLWLNRSRENKSWIRFALILVTAADLLLSQRWMLALAPDSSWLSTSVVDYQGTHQLTRGYRRQSRHWFSPDWKTSSSPDRLLDLVRVDVSTIRSRHHLTSQLPKIGASQSLRPLALSEIMRLARQHGELSNQHIEVLKNLGVQYVICPLTQGKSTIALETALPRAWVVHHVLLNDGPASYLPAKINRFLESLLLPGGEPADLQRQIVVDSKTVRGTSLRHKLETLSREPVFSDSVKGSAERCQFCIYQPQRIELDVSLKRPGVLVLADLYWPGWQARATNEQDPTGVDLPIFRVQHLFRGVWLPAGRHRVRFDYWPTKFYIAGTVSLLAWIIWLAWFGSNLVICFRRKFVWHFRSHT